MHCFTTRVAGIDVAHEKAEALQRLDQVHREVRTFYGVATVPFVTAQQVHDNRIGVIDAPVAADKCFDACDGLMTNQRGVCLGIYVADCCAVYLVDPIRRAIALVHSGKKGTELGIVANAIDRMDAEFGSAARDLVVQLSPCVRPPHYEIDFAAEIVRTCRDHGVIRVHDSGVCTACHLGRYYSYRAEKGRTGRMLALLALRP
ncbi:MAG: polyphenol oxidase family protein [Verrucomicrobiota bacterium]|nr:polyphenol oxidase family protein [Chthoniobacterales bacterium]MDQ3313421.1 polyphenol oxidase family protein [Verrucomicrobiota bacterium]